MDPNAIEQAVSLLVQARRTGKLIDGLPARCRPQTLTEAHVIQDATVAALQESVAGWKVGSPVEGEVVRGAILRSRVVPSGGNVSATQVPLLGLEAEVAFRFVRDLAPRERAYDYAEVAASVAAFAAIEIVDSRYRDYHGTPLLDRIADCVSNGAFVQGVEQPRWQQFDLSSLEARLEIDGTVVVRRVGGHPTRDPLLPAIDLVNDLRRSSGVRAGQFMTTGTYTGLNFGKPGQYVKAAFEGFGFAEVQIVP